MSRKITGFFFRNLWLKILSVGIGFLIWMGVSNVNNPTRTILFNSVPITIVNSDSVADIGKVVEPQGSGTVTLKVTAKKSVLQELSRTGSDFYVEADMENLNDMDTVPLTVTCSNSLVTWDQIEVAPASLKVTLEDKVEQTFVAAVTQEGTPTSGYEVGSTTVEEGKNIVIAGPASLMKIINQVVAPIDVDGMEEDSSVSSTLKVYDKNGDALTDTQMSSLEFKDESGEVISEHTVTVDVELWRIVTDVPIAVMTTGSPAWGYRVGSITTIPETISVAGTEEALTAMGSEFNAADQIDVSGATEDITAEIDLTTTLADMTDLKLITGADPSVQVQIAIEQNGDVTLDIPLSSINVSNRPENMNLVFTPADALTVKVHALNADAAKLTADDISLAVDLSVCANEGSYEIPVTVVLPEGYELASDVVLKVSSSKVEQPAEQSTEQEG